MSISICLFLACCNRLEANAFALRLSHQIIDDCFNLSPSSINNELSHLISEAPSARALYPDSALEREITLCFLDDQDTKLSLR